MTPEEQLSNSPKYSNNRIKLYIRERGGEKEREQRCGRERERERERESDKTREREREMMERERERERDRPVNDFHLLLTYILI